MLHVAPCTITEAIAYVGAHHRHSSRPRSGLFAVAIRDVEGKLRGVGIAGRPVSRIQQDGTTVEIIRVCTDGAPNGCSMLYGALIRAAKALGYRRVLTYTLESEPGSSLRAVGFRCDGPIRVKASWSVPSRTRYEQPDLFGRPPRPVLPRQRWEKLL